MDRQSVVDEAIAWLIRILAALRKKGRGGGGPGGMGLPPCSHRRMRAEFAAEPRPRPIRTAYSRTLAPQRSRRFPVRPQRRSWCVGETADSRHAFLPSRLRRSAIRAGRTRHDLIIRAGLTSCAQSTIRNELCLSGCGPEATIQTAKAKP